VAGLAGVAAAVAIVSAIFAKSSQSRAEPEPALKAAPAQAAPAAALSAPAEQITVSKQVALAIVPAEAHLYDGDKDLGTSPVLIEVEEGKTLTLVARLSGYKDLELSVDGSKPRESVKLERVAVQRSALPRPAPKKAAEPKAESGKKKGSLGGGEIVNPWAN
jgi:hypothetical protein